MTPEDKDFITTALAVVGAVLGVLNFWRAMANDRVKLRVRFDAGHRDGAFVIRVVNLSSFAVSVVDAGFVDGDYDHDSLTNDPILHNPFPRRIEARDFAEFQVSVRTIRGGPRAQVLGVYARVADGREFFHSPARWRPSWMMRSRVKWRAFSSRV